MARSVKYLGRIASVKDQETRDAWWAELREEVRSHAKSLTARTSWATQRREWVGWLLCFVSQSI